MNKRLVLVVLCVFACCSLAQAQTASGTLNVSGTIQGSISLVFDNDVAGPSLTGAGSSTATLPFGTVGVGVTPGTGVTITPGTGNYTVSAPFDVKVSLANSSSANFKLQAQLANPDATNTWTIAGNTVTSASQVTTIATGTYGSDVSQTLSVQIPNSSTATSISNQINFVATAN